MIINSINFIKNTINGNVSSFAICLWALLISDEANLEEIEVLDVVSLRVSNSISLTDGIIPGSRHVVYVKNINELF